MSNLEVRDIVLGASSENTLFHCTKRSRLR